MFSARLRQTLLASCMVMLLCNTAFAATQLDRTRLIVTQHDARAVIQIHSEDPLPLLLQAWIDESQAHRPDTAWTSSPPPFIADPPVIRLDPGKSRAIQVVLTATPDTLPVDRESLFWLNVLQVPTTPPGDSRLQITVQTRLKLFYRPRALAHYDAATLPPADGLRFTLERDASGQDWLRVHNPAPIHQTLATLTLASSHAAPLALDTPMLAPFETQRLALPTALNDMPPNATRQIRFATLDDNGNAIQGEQPVGWATKPLNHAYGKTNHAL